MSPSKQVSGAFSVEAKNEGEDFVVEDLVELKLERMSAHGVVIEDPLDEDADMQFFIDWSTAASSKTVGAMCECLMHWNLGPCEHLWAAFRRLDRLTDRIGDGDPLHLVIGHPLASPAPPPRESWERLLPALEAAHKSTDRSHTLDEGAEILYVLDREGTFRYGAPFVQFLYRRPKKSGGWTKPQRLNVPAHGFRNVDARERNLLRLLTDLPASYGWVSAGLARSDAILPAASWGELFPALCATGRFGLPGADLLPVPLSWDPGPAWRFRLRVDRTDQRTRAKGLLHREGEQVPLEEPLLLLRAGLVVFKNSIARLDLGDFEWISRLREDGEIWASLANEKRFIDALLVTPGLPEIELPDDLALLEVRVEPTRRVLFLRGADPRNIPARVLFDYDGLSVGEDEQRVRIVEMERRRVVVRDTGRETEWLGRLGQMGILPASTPPLRQVGAARFGEVVRDLLADGWIAEAQGKRLRPAGKMSWRLKSGEDWFDLQGSADFDGESVAFPALLQAVRRGESTIPLGDGTHGLLPDEWLRRIKAIAGLADEADGVLRFHSSQALILDALLAEEDDDALDARFREVRRRIRSAPTAAPLPVEKGFVGVLRPYQQAGLGWMDHLDACGLHGCLADDMGLGKTVQVLAFLQRVKRAATGRAKPSLIVVPRSLLENWIEEAHRFTPDLDAVDLSGPDRWSLLEGKSPDLLLTTYGIVRRDIFRLRDHAFRYVVLDEAQAVKTIDSQTAKACRLLRAEHRLAMTGTPLENHVGELWSIIEFLNPGLLGRSALARAFESGRVGGDDLKLLSRAVRPLILRRTKQQVLTELPSRTEQTLSCQLGEAERRDYDEIKRHFQASLKHTIATQGLAQSRFHVLEALLRLRQAACHPGLIDPRRAGEDSAKISLLVDHLSEILEEGHKALVFSQFTKLLAIVRRALQTRKIAYAYLDGKTRNRQQVVDGFQTDERLGVFLISLKAGGLGLNLTAASYVYILDPWWNPAVEAQAVDRTHRIGQTKPVTAYRLIAKDTVEEHIVKLQAHKRDLADAIVSESRGGLARLTEEDLERLLG